MEERNVDNAIVGLVDGGKVLGRFFDQWKENQAEELVGNAAMNDVLDSFDKVDEK